MLYRFLKLCSLVFFFTLLTMSWHGECLSLLEHIPKLSCINVVLEKDPDEKMRQCFDVYESSFLMLDVNSSSAYEKSKMIEALENVIYQNLKLQNQSKDNRDEFTPNHQELPFLIATQHLAERLLSLVMTQTFWEGSLKFGSGLTKFSNNSMQKNFFLANLRLFVDYGKWLEALYGAGTQSSLNEGDSRIYFPAIGKDILRITDLWFKLKGFTFLEFTLGKFAEESGEEVPEISPYYSFQSKMFFFKNPLNALSLHFRHNTLSLYHFSLNIPDASILEKNQVRLNYVLQHKESLQMSTSFELSWFYDPRNQLPGLSLGRSEPLTTRISHKPIHYKIFSHQLAFASLLNSLPQYDLRVFGYSKYWHNFADHEERNGAIATLGLRLGKLENTHFQFKAIKFKAGKNSIPILELSSFYFPGFDITAIEGDVFYSIRDNAELRLTYRRQWGREVKYSERINMQKFPIPLNFFECYVSYRLN